jgi:hypothetical protein
VGVVPFCVSPFRKGWRVVGDQFKSNRYTSLWILPRTSCWDHHAVPRHAIRGPPVRCRPFAFYRANSYIIAHSTGERRFGLPEPPIPFTGTHDATEFGASCHQLAVKLPPNFPIRIPGPTNTMSEDCMTRNFDLRAQAHEFYRSFHQCCTPRKYPQEETTPGSLCK